MRMKFTGQYTNGRATIAYLGCEFTGHEPREVPENVATLLANHPEFEAVADEPVEAAPKPVPKPRRKRR